MKTPKRILKAIKSRKKRLQFGIKRVMVGKKVANDLSWTFLGDIADFMQLTKYLEKNNIRAALDTYQNLDTNPREQLPLVIINYLESFANYRQ